VKSGRKIFEMLEDHTRGRVAAIRHLGNGDLRSLLVYVGKGRRTYADTPAGEMISALAIVEGTRRFVYGRKGRKGKGLTR